MSSTARGGKRSPADFYSTPPWVTHRLLERLQLPGGLWFEPSAGDGAIIKTVNNVRSDVRWSACELREECQPLLVSLIGRSDVLIGDFLTTHLGMKFDVLFGNPPFSLAMEFIEKSLPLAPWVIYLLRLNFFGTSERNAFFQREIPDCYVIPNRVSFTGDGKADSIEYMWAVWGPERGRRTGKIEVLNDTPVEQRR